MASGVPTREFLLKQMPAMIQARRGQLIIIHHDVQLVALPQGRSVVFAWSLVLECVGALIGAENNCVYSHIIIDPQLNIITPRCPSSELLEASIATTMIRLNEIRAKQLIHRTPPQGMS